MKPPIHPAMRELIREDDRQNREERKRAREADANPLATEACIWAAVEEFEKNGGVIEKLPMEGPLVKQLMDD